MTSAATGMSVLLLMLAGLLGMGRTALAAEQPQYGGTLTVGLAADIAHLDIFHALGYEAIWALASMTFS